MVVVMRRPRRALGAPADDEPIESTFATVRHRTKVTKHLVAQADNGAPFGNGKPMERPHDQAQPEVA
jgi:hypothetical protein